PARKDRPLIRADPGGWTWVARVTESIYQWTRMNFDNSRPPEDWLPPELRSLCPVGTRGGQDVSWRIATRPAGAGYFLAGAAAATSAPASSHGVWRAPMSGFPAGHQINHIISRRIDDLAAIAYYNRLVEDWFRHDSRELTDLYGRLGHDACRSAIHVAS